MQRLQSLLVAATFSALITFTTCPASDTSALERQAEQFVSLSLSLGRQQPEEVDAYFGPRALAERAAIGPSPNVKALLRDARALLADLEANGDASADSSRHARLLGQVRAFTGLLEIFESSGTYPFEAEAQRIYGMTLLSADGEKSSGALQTLDALLPGPGSLASRVDRFRNQFIVPPDRRKAVFARALSECRTRTRAKWRLPASEQLNIKWSGDVPAAWHKYEGNYRSTLQVNPAAVAYLRAALDVACHEGYPGHHAQFVVLESGAGPGGLAVEDKVVLLRSPISMLREGAASYGVELAFTPDQRLAFERDVLFPLAGLDAGQARKYDRVNRLIEALGSSVIPVVRDYRDRRLSRELALRALESSALVSSSGALLDYVDRLGPYVLGYTAARDNVRNYIDAEHGRSGEDRWSILHHVLAHGSVAPLRR